MPVHTAPSDPPSLPADIAALLDAADPNTAPVADTTGPADDVDVDQDPGYEEVELTDDQADTSLDDPTVMEA